jgi:hypothetical protein
MINKLLLITLAFLLWATTFIFGQSIGTTKATAGWNPEYVGSTIVVSNKSGFNNPAQPGVYPWHSAPMPPPASLSLTYLSLQADGSGHYGDGGMTTTITGLIPGYSYIIKCSVMASLYFYNNGTATTQWPASASVIVNNGVSVAKSDITFSPGINTNKWLQQSITFTAKQTTATFGLLTKVPSDAKGVVSLDMISDPINETICNFGNASQVNLTSNFLTNTCPAKKVNLNTTFTGTPPQGSSLVWFSNPQHTGWAVLDPTNVTVSGSYYAFFYDSVGDCYNTDNSTRLVQTLIKDCCNAGTAQVSLLSNFLTNICPAKKVNLNNAFTGTSPAGSSLVWFDNPQHTGVKIADPTSVTTSGFYYAFFYDSANNCYNTANSTAMVQSFMKDCCKAGTAQVPLTGTTLKNICPSQLVDLRTLMSGLPPDGTDIVFYSTANHADGTLISGSEIGGIKKINVGVSGTYYAFFYDEVSDCFNTANSTSAVVVTITPCPPPCDAGTAQVVVNASLKNVCPATTVNLNDAGPALGKPIKWFTDATHTNAYPNPTTATAGTYYAFYYDAVNDCWNTNNSTAKVVVTISVCPPPCNAGTDQVILNTAVANNICPAKTADLSTTFTGSVPNGTLIYWYDNAAHTGNPISGSAVGAGTYYAFYYDAVNNCWNTNNSTAKVTVTINRCDPCNAGAASPTLSATSITNVCPSATVNLSALVNSIAPAGAIVKWYTSAVHAAGTEVSNPSSVGASGVYFAYYYDAVNNCWSADHPASVNVTIALCCKAGTAQVILTGETNFQQNCPSSTFNLNNTFTGSAPAGTSLVWFTDALHAAPVLDPTAVKAGFYYAFFYDAVNHCYNTDISDAKVYVTAPPQVGLSATTSSLCPPATIDLNTLLQGFQPVGSVVRWFDNATHSGVQVADPSKAGLGTYYAFFYFAAENCYNTDNSTSKVVVSSNCGATCNAGTEQVLIGNPFPQLRCPGQTFDLANFIIQLQLPPAGTEFVWFDNPQRTGSPIQPTTSVSAGTYYCFLYDSVNNCYNTNNSTAVVTVLPAEQATLSKNVIENNCPKNGFNTDDFYDIVTNANDGILRWFDNPTHSGQWIEQDQIVGTGVYYAFYYFDDIDCYNTENSTAKLTATVTACASAVQLGVKVALQGSMPGLGTTMRNDLQKYTSQAVVGVLPKTDPYGNGAVYNDINNPAGVAGNVVDWVKVEIKSAISPFAVLESKSLLLRTDGYLVDVNGQYPSFTQPVGFVFIVVKHRNHLAIRSTPVNLLAGSVDFTTSLSTVYNDGSAPDQMKLINGIWCMISGDVSQDYFVSNQDVTQTRNAFKTGGVGVYSSRDLNMNAFLENQDVTAQRNRFNAGFLSIVSKF